MIQNDLTPGHIHLQEAKPASDGSEAGISEADAFAPIMHAPSFRCFISFSAGNLVAYKTLTGQTITDAEKNDDKQQLDDLLREQTAFSNWLSWHMRHCDDCLCLLAGRFHGGPWK